MIGRGAVLTFCALFTFSKRCSDDSPIDDSGPTFEDSDSLDDDPVKTLDVPHEEQKDEEIDLYDGHQNWCEWTSPPLCGKQKVRNPKTRRKETIDHGSCGKDHRGI